MPGEELASNRQAMGALLFMAAGTNVFDVYSALNSSPWTAENFGSDPEKANSCMEYVRHSIVWTSGYFVMSAYIAGSWWPIAGGVAANAYLYWLYRRALQRGAVAGSTGWAKGAGQ